MPDPSPPPDDPADRRADGAVLPLVYDELRRLAAARLADDPAGASLDPTALVHEAYLRLAAAGRWQSDRHYFHAAARTMRRILVDRARARAAAKRDHKCARTNLDTAPAGPDLDLVALDDALTVLATDDPQAAELVHLRFFAGRTRDQAAELLGISPRQADRVWAFARAWLYARVADS
jgi:RNA polymerase sigma factor (TIGR02999 family)